MSGSIHHDSDMPLPPEGIDLEQKIAEVESGYIRAALKQADGVRTKAAELRASASLTTSRGYTDVCVTVPRNSSA